MLCAVAISLLLVAPSYAQEDTTMQIKRFTFDDLDSEKFEKYKTSSSTNRLAENPEDLTQEVIIIDGDEIRKFGYTTLVDILKTIPGFRTSQPGNAIEGETFLMRGLLGNDHTKILINGIPIKPEAVKSMPIAAQLPIRHAEYIEIVQGPSSATYGSDAMAGVINIVLPDVDRPVFAWADVSGVTPATSDINLTLGGKAGSGKNILNYQIFASSQRARNVNLRIKPDSIRIDPQSLNQWERDLYRWDLQDTTLPDISSLSRESRMIGVNFQFRGFELYTINMYREEHSAFGNSPLAVSYSDPSTTMGENINTLGIRYVGNKRPRFTSRTSVSIVNYKTLENSSYIAIRDSLSAGRNYLFARSFDFRADYQGILKVNDQFKLAFGTTSQYSISNPYTSYLGRPVREGTIGLGGGNELLSTVSNVASTLDSISAIDSWTYIPTYGVLNFATFVHFLYKTKDGKLTFEGAARTDNNTSDGFHFTPKVGVMYRPVDKLKLVVNYSRGHRAPRSYHLHNNYSQRFEELPSYNSGNQGEPSMIDFSEFNLRRNENRLKTEVLQGIEFRTVWDVSPHIRLSGRYYSHFMQNRVTRQHSFDAPPLPPPGESLPEEVKAGYGYFSSDVRGTYSVLHAVMATVEFRKSWNNFGLVVVGGYEYAEGYEEIEGDLNAVVTFERASDYRFVPLHSTKLNVNLAFKNLSISINNNLFGWYISDIYVRNRSVVFSAFDGLNHNTDILLHKELFRQISVFAGIYNVFNSFQSGIPASTLSNSWGYNPQYGRTYKIGLNFRLN